MLTFLLLFLRLESKSLVIFQIAHSPPLKLIIFVNIANHDFKAECTRSVVWNSLIVLQVRIIKLGLNFHSWSFLWGVLNSFKMHFKVLKYTPVASEMRVHTGKINLFFAVIFILHQTVNTFHHFCTSAVYCFTSFCCLYASALALHSVHAKQKQQWKWHV
jgi:hypothetical protein